MPGRFALLQDYFLSSPSAPTPRSASISRCSSVTSSSSSPPTICRSSTSTTGQSFGVYVTDRKTGETVFYSGDTKFDYTAYSRMLHDAKIVFHEVQLTEQENPVHALLSELRTMPANIRAARPCSTTTATTGTPPLRRHQQRLRRLRPASNAATPSSNSLYPFLSFESFLASTSQSRDREGAVRARSRFFLVCHLRDTALVVYCKTALR